MLVLTPKEKKQFCAAMYITFSQILIQEFSMFFLGTPIYKTFSFQSELNSGVYPESVTLNWQSGSNRPWKSTIIALVELHMPVKLKTWLNQA